MCEYPAISSNDVCGSLSFQRITRETCLTERERRERRRSRFCGREHDERGRERGCKRASGSERGEGARLKAILTRSVPRGGSSVLSPFLPPSLYPRPPSPTPSLSRCRASLASDVQEENVVRGEAARRGPKVTGSEQGDWRCPSALHAHAERQAEGRRRL
eukprot:scaffold8643_cov24-Tisochrysis_lutea.AAC.2